MDISFDTWAKFAKSGRIEDYIRYKALSIAMGESKNVTNSSAQEANVDATEHRWSGDTGTGYR